MSASIDWVCDMAVSAEALVLSYIQSLTSMFLVHRDRDHRHKEVHWPPPLSVPEHLEDLEVPDSFKCPITFAIMKEPATTRNG